MGPIVQSPWPSGSLGGEPGKLCGEPRKSALYGARDRNARRVRCERKLGPIRMIWNSRDEAILKTLMSWKSQQYRTTGCVDNFSRPWTRQLLHRLLHLDSLELQGLMSALFAGDELVAVHFGLRCRNAVHFWFPAFSLSHARMSPGTELFLRTAAHAPREDVDTLDMGIGEESYKRKLTNEKYSVVRGSVDLVPWRSTLRAWGREARHQVARLPWSKGAMRALSQTVSALNPLNDRPPGSGLVPASTEK